MKKYLPYILLGLLLAGISVYLQYNALKPLDWRPTFSKEDKIPFGCYALYHLLPEVLPEQEIIVSERSPYLTLNDKKFKGKNFLVINQYLSPDDYETEYILAHADSGNQVFLAMESVFGKLKDTLNLEIESHFVAGNDSINLYLDNEPENENPEKYPFFAKNATSYFSSYDTSLTEVLGYNEKQDVNFIKVKWGKGNILVHSNPHVFTNYYLVFGNDWKYAFKCLSYLPEAPLIWDEYYKMGESGARSNLSYVFQQEPLRWAYFILVTALLFYIVFEGKRKQKIIPVIKPLRNSTVEFTESVGRLYLQYRDHKNIADKKISYFYDFLRSKLYIKPDPENNDEFFEKLSLKTGIEKEKILNLFRYIKEIENRQNITEDTLINLNKMIDEFYNSIIGRGTGAGGRGKEKSL